MKTAKEWRDHLIKDENQTLIFADGTIEQIQNEAFKEGMKLAASFADDYVDKLASNSAGQNIAALIRDEINATANATTKPF